MVWSIKYKDSPEYGIEILDYYNNEYIRGTGDRLYKVPSVAKTIKYFNIYNRKINFSRNNLFIRDDFTCQYCGIKLAQSQLTYDHIIPKSRFLKNKTLSTNWTNIVTACRPCNHRKANRTPVEAGMQLIKQPIEPQYGLKYLPWYQEASTITNNSTWEPFIKNMQNV
jgi:5-methylcytosine-specific restriction endonuclease McrA